MPSASAAATSCASAGPVIIVPVGLAGLATSTPLSGARRCAAIRLSTVIDQRVASEISIGTGSQPSAVRMWRYGGEAGPGAPAPAPGADHPQEGGEKTPRQTRAAPTAPA